MLQPGDVVPRIDPQLGHEDRPQVLEDPQRLGLAPGTVQRQHALRPQPLPHRVRARERRQLSDEPLVTAHGQLGVDARLRGGEAELFQPPGLRPGERLVPHLAVGGAPPDLQRLGQPAGRLTGTTPGEVQTPLADQLFEPVGVGHLRRDVEEVPRCARDDEVLGCAGVAQALAHTRDRRAQGDLGAGPVVGAPQRVHQPVDRDGEAAVDEEAGDQCSGLHAPDVGDPVVPRQFQRAEDTDLEPPLVGSARRCVSRGISPRHVGSPDLSSRPRC